MMAGRKVEWPGGQGRLSRRDLTIVALDGSPNQAIYCLEMLRNGARPVGHGLIGGMPVGRLNPGFTPGLRVRTICALSAARSVKSCRYG